MIIFTLHVLLVVELVKTLIEMTTDAYTAMVGALNRMMNFINTLNQMSKTEYRIGDIISGWVVVNNEYCGCLPIYLLYNHLSNSFLKVDEDTLIRLFPAIALSPTETNG